MGKAPDTFEMWRDNGLWPKYRDFLKEASRKSFTQKEICRRLQLEPATFIRLKKRHKEIIDALEEGKVGLKDDLINGMLQLALGYDEITTTQLASEKTNGGSGKGGDKKAYRQVRHVGPDYQALIYLLKINFGIDYDPNSEQIKLMIKKAKEGKEIWGNGKIIKQDSDKEDQ